ncbi:MAG TPA: TRAM domain-containing protein [Acidimicrobiales bacterium]|nr:TRAM domain-containing protein [Acidimicrobiales bacterium]
MDRPQLHTTGVAKGGAAIARDADGRVVFVRGALPDEVVMADIVEAKRDYATAELRDVIEPSPWRIEPPCPFVAAGCGGCDLQHASVEGQRALKVRIVEDALKRVARLPQHPAVGVISLPGVAYRSTVRGVVRDRRFAFRRRASHDAVSVATCLVAHPLIDALIRDGDFGASKEVTLRCGVNTGDRLVIASPRAKGIVVAGGVAVVGRDELRRGAISFIHEEVAGVRFRVSARSFFQARADGAAALVEAVSDFVGDLPSDGVAVDLYAGVGLFAATALARWPEVLAVEQSSSSVGDCRVNVPQARVVRGDVDVWPAQAASVVVADPSRQGLGVAAADRVAATGAPRVVLVSCDPAAFGRDVALLEARGYGLEALRVVDLFPQTSHVEVVSRFDRR